MMEVKFTKTTCFIFALVSSLVIINVTGRPLRGNSSDELVSDGIDDQHKKLSSYLVLNGVVDYSKKCEHMYGFLPCAESLWGHLFLILVYEYLLFHGESYVASGGERIFKILGPGVFGASAFEILGALPESFILLASGLLNNTEKAQEYALTGVGLLAGTTIFLLTIVWGTCIIIGSTQDPSNLSNSSIQSQVQRLISKFNGYRVTTDAETSYMARIMVLSVVPFLIILIPKFFQISLWGEHFFIIIALIVSVLFLASYFVYQVFEPWIQRRRLDYVKHEHLVIDILKQLQERTVEKILTEDGAPNVPVIRSLFQKIDHDGDNLITFSELRELLYEVRFRNSNWDKDKKLAEVMDEFDIDGDRKITMDEFVTVFTKWLDETKRAMDKQYRSVKSLKDIYKILQPWIQNKRKEHEIKKQLVSEIIRHVQRSALGSLFTEDGTPDVSAVKRLFVSIDLDEDNCISQEELKELIVKINIGKVPWEVDEIVKNIMEDLDVNGDHVINEEEFTSGLLKWLDENQARDSTEADDDTYQRKWDEIETLALEERSIEKSIWSMTKAIMLLVIGIVMLALLAEPLIESVHNFSESAEIPSFFISFILVPLATNARGAISAIKAASRKKEKTTSLTLSEIYGAVFINNLLGFSVLLYLIYFWGLSWKFSAEVLIVLIVSLVMGFTASFNSTFQIWKSFVAYLLYPLSLLLVYLLHR